MKKLNVKLPQGGSKRALHSGMYASALAVVVLAVIILVNLVIRALPTKYTEYDISTTSLFTLSDTTENLLHELNADVTAYYLAESGQEDANITRLLDRYAGESSHFSWQQRDPVLYPTFAQQYDGASAGSVVLVCGDNSDVLSYNDMYEMDLESYYTTGTANYSFQAENALTSGIAKVTRTAAYQLYELTGHGETALSDDFTDTLSNAGLTDAETTILKDYVANGGKLFVTTDFTTGTPNLDSVLADCGMARQPGLLIETDTDHYPYGYPQTYLLPKLAGNDITAGVSQSMMIYTPIAQGITTNDDSEFAFTDLLTTGDNAYSMENYATAETAQKADTDPEGCFAVAVAADNSATGARVVWVNCPNLLESNINQAVSGGNAQFLGSVVNWMNGEQTTAVINAKSMSAASLSVPTSAAIPLGVLFTLVLPIVCIIAGAVVCVVRRRR